MATPLDWSLLQAFLAVAEGGSLSAAARATGISQPTLGRHIRRLQALTGADLFRRTATGQTLTDAGAALLPEARAMRDAAARATLAAAGRSAAIEGTVRITASRIMALHVLPPVLADLRDRHPALALEIVASDATQNLLFREADIALRMIRPEGDGLVAQKVADLPLGLYAARAWIDRHGMPETVDDLRRAPFVGYDRSDLLIRGMAEVGVTVDRTFFPLRCDDTLVQWALVRAGAGIGAVLRLVGDADPGVVRVAPALPLPVLPVWLAAPEALRAAPRIRTVQRFLAARLAALRPA